MSEVQTKKMYRVERFVPTHCPACEQKFDQEGHNYDRFLGYAKDGNKRPINYGGGNAFIMCTECENITMIMKLEEYQLGNYDKAHELLDKGFVNLTECQAYGNACEDAHIVYSNQGQAKEDIARMIKISR